MSRNRKTQVQGSSKSRMNQNEMAIENEFNLILQGAYLELASDLIK